MFTIAQALEPLIALPSDGTLWVGFSGGLDSTVLLHALSTIPKLKSRVQAVHVHHGLSLHADAWLEHCRAQCQVLDVPFFAERVQLNVRPDGLEQAARIARYQVYAQHAQAGDTLLLAHHADDQLETFFMRVTRGAGIQGLASMASQRPLNTEVKIQRPLLAIPRQQLERYAAEQGLTWVEDESNQDSSYERNWWRNELLPRLWAAMPQRKISTLRSIAQLQQDRALLQEFLEPIIAAVTVPWSWPNCAVCACNILALQQSPVHHHSYLLKGWLQRLQLLPPSARWLQSLQLLIDAAPDRQPQLALGEWQLHRHHQYLYLQTEVAMPTAVSFLVGTQSAQAWAGGMVCGRLGSVGLKAGSYQLVPAAAVRSLVLQPAGRPHKTLKALFQEAGVPASLRAQWPAIMDGNKLCALVGIAIAAEYTQSQGWEITWQ